MKRIITFCLCVLTLPVMAQKKNFGDVLSFRTGVNFVDASVFADYKKDNTFGINVEDFNTPGSPIAAPYYGGVEPSGTIFMFGLGGYGVTNNFVYDFELNFGSNFQSGSGSQEYMKMKDGAMETVSRTTKYSGLYMADAFASFGYMPVRVDGFTVFPLIGLGYSAFAMRTQASGELQATDQGGNHMEWVPEKQQNKENALLTTYNFATKFGVRGEYHFGPNTPEKAKGFTLGLEAGYKLAFPSNWTVNGESLPSDNDWSAPNWGPSGMYFRLTIGGGSVGEK